MILELWNAHEDFRNEDVKHVPIWVQLLNLDIKYWGEIYLFKIICQIRTHIHFDSVTKKKERLSFSRVLIEVSINQDFPTMINFINDRDQEVDLMIHYELKPVSYSNCKLQRFGAYGY